MPGKGAVCWPIQRITSRWPSQGNSMKNMGTPFVQRHLISDIMNKILVRNYFLHQISQMRTFHVGYYKYLRLFDKKIFLIWYHKWVHLISDITNTSILLGCIFTSDITNDHIWYLILQTSLSFTRKYIYIRYHKWAHLVSDIRNKTSIKKNHC